MTGHAALAARRRPFAVRLRGRALPPHAYFLGSATFHYLGPAFAVLLFARVSPLGVAWLRIASAAVVFAAWRKPWRHLSRVDPRTRRLLVELGAVFAVMNSCFYLAIARLPLGTVAAIEFLPVIVLAALGVRTLRNALALALAIPGVYILTDVRMATEPVGIAFAFANAALFALYIVLAHRISRAPTLGRIDGLAAAMLVAAVAITPIGGAAAVRALTDPIAIGAGIGVGLASSVIPYVCDQLAMARLPRPTYSLLVSLLPATATVIGVIVLTQIPSLRDLIGIALIVLAVGIHREASSARPGPRDERNASGDGTEAVVSRTQPPGRRPAEPLEVAATVLLDRLAVDATDSFLVVCNREQAELANLVAEAARRRTSQVTLHEFPAGSRDGEEPPREVASALANASAIVCLTSFSLSQTQARLYATRRGARIASSPAITAAAFARAVPIDYGQLAQAGATLAASLSAADRCRVTSSAGTEIEFSLRAREGISDDGDLRRPGAFGNLPAGEAYIAPVESSAQGTIVFDGSLSGWGLLHEPLTIRIKHGRVGSAFGGAAADWLLAALDAGGAGGRTIAELGLGTNPAATVSGVFVEDEKTAGTAHIAFGSNIGMGGTTRAAVHIDGLMLQPTIVLDGTLMLSAGRLQLAPRAA